MVLSESRYSNEYALNYSPQPVQPSKHRIPSGLALSVDIPSWRLRDYDLNEGKVATDLTGS